MNPMNREQMICEVQRAAGFDEHDELTLTLVQARVILDVILPQVTTIEELGELPANTKLLDSDGAAWELRHNGFDHGGPWLKGTTGAHQHYSVHAFLPLTIVWRP